jgi:hypothetical protein
MGKDAYSHIKFQRDARHGICHKYFGDLHGNFQKAAATGKVATCLLIQSLIIECFAIAPQLPRRLAGEVIEVPLDDTGEQIIRLKIVTDSNS